MIEEFEQLNCSVVGLIGQVADIGIPAQTKIQGKVGRDLVVVLEIERQLMDLLIVIAFTI